MSTSDQHTSTVEAIHWPDEARESVARARSSGNERSSGGTFVMVGGSVTVPAIIKNNIFWGPGTTTNQAIAVLAGNFSGDPLLASQSGYDYRLKAGSPAINAGVDPGTGPDISLVPVLQYVHPAASQPRPSDGTLDVGAYEYGTPVVPQDAGVGVDAGAGTDAGAQPGDGDGGAMEAGSNDGPITSFDANGESALDGDSGCSCDLSGRIEMRPGLMLWMLFLGLAMALRCRPARAHR